MIGSALFEDLSSNDVTLCTYSGIDSSKENVNPGQVFHPRQMVSQSVVIDYPILAYKSLSPDNRDIVLVHLSQKIP